MAAAVREYKATALTGAFILGAVVFPALIWGGIFAFSVFSSAIVGEREPIRGTIAVLDTTEGGAAVEGIELVFDPRAQAERRQRQLEQVRAFIEANPELAEAVGGQAAIERAIGMAAAAAAAAESAEVDVEALGEGADLEEVRRAVREGERLALVVVDELSLALSGDRIVDEMEEEGAGDASAEGEDGVEEEGEDGAREPGEYEVYHSVDLDPEYLDQIRRAAHRAIQDERYRRFGIDPDTVLAVADNSPRAVTRLITAGGEEAASASNFQRFLPFVFLFLMYGAVLTGGNYLLMGTLEEKQSRVMEVLLSAVSPWQLLIGKMIGQALVGATVLVIYGGVGFAAAQEFGLIGLVPMELLPLALVYFLMAYLFLGAMMTAVGAAVTDFREAQALYPPITVSLLLPFLLLIALMENPASVLGVIFSYFPPTTPFVMVMRLSNPAYPVPTVEVVLSIVVGFLGVAGMIWLAARVFRVGVLNYGKAPNLIGLLKWARQG